MTTQVFVLFCGFDGDSPAFLNVISLLRLHLSCCQPVEKSTAEREREAERERDRHSPFSQRHLHTHHHTHVGMGYPLIPGQYDPFQGEPRLSAWNNEREIVELIL